MPAEIKNARESYFLLQYYAKLVKHKSKILTKY